MKKFVLCLCVVALFSGNKSIHAQEYDLYKTKIALKSRNYVSGYLKLNKLPAYISLYSSAEDSLLIPIGMVNSISIKNPSQNKISFEISTQREPNKYSFFNETFFGLLSGEGEDIEVPNSSLTAEMINGISILTYLKLGLGVGYDQYGTTRIIPFFLSIRGNILNKKITPFYFLDIGGGSAKDTRESDWGFSTSGGAMYHVGLGIKAYSGSKMNISLSLGYKIQDAKYIYDGTWGIIQETSRTFRRASIRLGIGF